MKTKPFLSLMLVLVIVFNLSVLTGCSSNKKLAEEKEKYIQSMKDYAEDKYDKEFTIKESKVSQSIIYSENDVGFLALKDENDILFNVSAFMTKPDNFKDNYVESLVANKLEESIDMKNMFPYGFSKLYTILNDRDHENIDYSTDNIRYIDFRAVYGGEMNDKVLTDLYNVYLKMQEINRDDFCLTIWLAKETKEMKNVVENYDIYVKYRDEPYSTKINAYIVLSEPGLTFEDFKDKIVKH